MKKHLKLFAQALLLAVAAPGCVSMVDSKTDRQAIEVCSLDTDCGAGLECEIENGVGTCQPHGGDGAEGEGDDDASDDQSDDTAPPSDPGTPTPPSGACQTDADCGAGLECELEHGTSSCQPHGGDDN